eukprot:TRINITY_DN9112_c0_g1_i1.p1 TRINITY_DN9112_c0_g1~~TRINITY_DN9112_c0_g1_i1.p1  ORF type:complete len:827 (+),score=257.62 TRINITY_DN9112_c0_g1_i1:54-2534(+)
MLSVVAVAAVAASALVNEHPGDPASAAQELVQRVIPDHAASFETEVVPKQDGKAVFGLTSRGGKIVLQGSGGVEMSSALNWYLNNYLNVTYDWNTYGAGQMPPKGATLPMPPATGIMKQRQVPWSYYMNVCTYGYSLAFVPWEYWVKHIDWMAMNGINLPLAFIGQEWLWQQVFLEYNLTAADMAPFFGGPAFLPWSRMGNMRGWGGPLTQNWLDSRKDLQIQILARMRGLGMTPVLSAFAGHIPAALSAKLPHAKVSRSPPWAGFSGEYGQVYMVEPTDPLYQELGTKFIKLQEKVFGTDHIYNCDTYNEMTPPTSDTKYLKAASTAVYNAMAVADPGAIWLMQGWLFFSARTFWRPAQVQAYLSGVADDKMWILDLFGSSNPVWSRTDSFYGKPFIFCTLLNFGGQQGITGNLPQTLKGFEATIQKNSTVLGVGITMEGIWQNYPAFELTLQLAWLNASSVSVPDWVARYGDRRYGGSHPGTTAAWKLLEPAYEGHGGGFGSAISTYPGNLLKKLDDEGRPHRLADIDRDIAAGHAANVACTWGSEQSGYLAGCAGGGAGGCESKLTLAEAQAACDANQQCTGITKHGLGYELRGGEAVLPSPSGESSWLIINMAACHPGFVPPGDMWSKALGGLLNDSAALSGVEAYRFDLVDVARQALSAVFTSRFGVYKTVFFGGNKTEVARLGAGLLEIIDDYDRLLSTDTNFMLGRWTNWSRGWGATEDEKNWLEFNARNQITLWGDHGEINDYAKKEWGGLVRDYYRRRWEILVAQANNTAPHWDQSAYFNSVYNQVELPFSNATNVYPVHPEADAVSVASAIYSKYF